MTCSDQAKVLKSKDDSWLWRQIALTPHGNLRLAWTFLGLLVPGQPWSGVVLAEETSQKETRKRNKHATWRFAWIHIVVLF
jgi:hypothetical protein